MGVELRGLEGVTPMKVLSIPAIRWDWKLVLVLVVISIFPATYLVTSLRSMKALSSRKQYGKRPPILPYWIPFLGSLASFVRDGPRLAAKLT